METAIYGRKSWDKQFILLRPQAVPHTEVYLLKSFDEKKKQDEEREGRTETGVAAFTSTRSQFPELRLQVYEGKVETYDMS